MPIVLFLNVKSPASLLVATAVSRVCGEEGVRGRTCLCIFLSVPVLEASLDLGLKLRQFSNENAFQTMSA